MAWISDIKDKNEKYLMGNNEHSVGLKKECYRKNGNLFTSEKLRIQMFLKERMLVWVEEFEKQISEVGHINRFHNIKDMQKFVSLALWKTVLVRTNVR